MLSTRKARQAAQDIANCKQCGNGMSIIKVYNRGTDAEYWAFKNPRLCKIHHNQFIEGGTNGK